MVDRLTVDRGRFASAEVAGEVFLMDHRTGDSFRIDGSGARLWQLFLDGSTLEQAAERVAAETGAPLDVVRPDAERFVRQLAEMGALVGQERSS